MSFASVPLGLALLLTAVPSAAAQGERAAARPAPPPADTDPAGEPDRSWYPFELAPPFVGPLVEGAEDSRDTVYAGSAVFTVAAEPELPDELREPLLRDGRFAPGWFLVHFEAAARPEDKALLDLFTGPLRRADGSRLARWYVPNDAFAVWVDDVATYALLAGADRVDWVGRYQPAYKLDPTLGTARLSSPERVGRAVWRLNLDLMPGHPAADVERAAAALGASVLTTVELRGARDYDVRFVVVEVPPALVVELARIEGVRTIQEAGDGLRVFDLSGGGKLQARSLTVDDGSASPVVTNAAFPLWRLHDLQGQGQVIGVVDTSLDWNNVGTSGCATGSPDAGIQNYGFALPNLARVLLTSVAGGGVNLKVPRSDELGGATLLGIAQGEHGAGVAGAALADFYANDDTRWWEHDVDTWESWAPTNYSGLLGPGIAHEAQLYFTSVMDSSNNFRWEFAGEFESHMGTTLANMAAAGVCTTNHSVGLAEASNTYTQVSVVHDVRAYDHPDMLQCMAAGNDGAGTNRLSSQAVVKNALTVGASDDVLNPEARVTFSSTGPRFDGGRKPDVMAPGDDTAGRAGGVASLLILPDANGSSSASCEYQWTAGTSFASPIAAGAGALVHQYFEEGRYPGDVPLADASAALIKACLVNAGHRLTGANLGPGTYPSDYQGWGEPNLSDVLDHGSGPRRLVAYDVPAASGFTSSASTPDSYALTVLGSAERLRVTLVWTDEPGSTGVGKKLVNDLDLRVQAPGGALYRGNVIDGASGLSTTGGSADTLNNVENVLLAAPATGTWTVTVDPGPGGYASGQGYALVVTGEVDEGGGGPAAPVADFSAAPTSGGAPLNVAFSDLSTGSVSSWSWTFGDGGSSTAQDPVHPYALPGTYDVTLTVTGPGGSDAETKLGYVTVTGGGGGGALWYLSFDTTASVPGVGSVADEDVVSYDPATGTWALYFDGSDVGVAGLDVDALHVLEGGDLVLSFDLDGSVPGLVGGPNGTSVDDSDLVLFSFTSSGPSTSGTFQFVFDGSDVGLTSSSEDIDGVYEFPGGGLALSTLGNPGVPGLSGLADEDVLYFAASAYGAATSGSWGLQWDGSDVGFGNSSSDDLNALTFDDGVDLLFSTTGNYAGAGSSGNDEDVSRFVGLYGSATSGTAALELDLSALGISTAEDVDGLSRR